MTLHIFTAGKQPATRWVAIDGTLIEWPAHRLAYCTSCGRRRRLRNMSICAYYDTLHLSCAPECAPKKRRSRRRKLKTPR